jgi:prevent-host-death family protein
MPTIRTSADLRNNYNEISELCHEYAEPVFITKNGTGDLVVMSIETYELVTGKMELYSLIDEGVCQMGEGKVKPLRESLTSIRTRLNQ